MLRDPDFRKNLLVSIVTSVLVLVFIEPILKLSANGIMWLGENISAAFTTSVYTSAAFGFREKYSFIHLLLFISIVAGGMTGVEISNLRRKNRSSQQPRNKAKSSRLIGTISAIAFILSSIYSLSINFIELQLNASFNQRVVVLAARVPDDTVKTLRASWALMESRSDYEAINSKMNELAKEYNTRLPIALWQ